VILPRTDTEEALLIAERIRQAVEENPFAIDGTEVRITVSIGVSTTRPDTEASSLFKKADDAMYLAKRSGRNRVERVE
jgi:diguanylate cyclase (GGDEF)-like protein